MSNNFKLWDEFKDAFVCEIKKISEDTMYKAWSSSGARTEFYTNDLFPKIASKLELIHEKEAIFRIDSVMFKKSHKGHKIPVICIESENNANSSVREVYKLCAINAPLKILFLCLNWDADIRDEYTVGYLDNIISAFAEISKLSGYFGIIIAEKTDKFRFHTVAFNSSAKRENVVENFLVLDY